MSAADWPSQAREDGRRYREAAQQIADARAEPTLEELQAQNHDPQGPIAEAMKELDAALSAVGNELSSSQPPASTITLSGPRLAAYVRLEAAAKASQAAQAALAATGAELRDAFGELCKTMTEVG